MNLCYELPDSIKQNISLPKDEKIRYCSPYDIDEMGSCITGGYVVVTEHRILVANSDEIVKDVKLKDCSCIKSEVLINNGILVANMLGQDTIIARYSMKHVTRFSYIARGADLIAHGDNQMVESKEIERVCEKCGKMLPGTSVCPHCDGHSYTLKRFWKLCGNYQYRLIAVSFFMLIASAINLVMPAVQREFVDNVLVGRSGGKEEVLVFILKMFVLTMSLLGVNLLRNWWCGTLGAGISMQIRRKLYGKIQRLSLSYMQTRKPGDIMNRIVNDTQHIRSFMEDTFSNLISSIVTMIGAFLAMLYMDPILSICSTGLFVVIAIMHRMFRNRTRRMFHTQRHKEDKLSSSLQDVISGIRVVKSFGKEKEEAERFQVRVEEYSRIQKRNEVFWASFFPIITFIMGIGLYLATFFGGISVLENRMTTGQLLQFISYTGILYGPMGWMNQIPRMWRRMLTSLERCYDILDEEPEIMDDIMAIEHEIKGEVEFDKVAFGYKSYEPVLTGINLKVAPGEMIGLVGPSGAGKSTMINLIMRLYDVDQGNIRIDGVDIKNIKMDHLHSQIGVVLQETFLFSGTILNNILFSKPDATMEEVIQAAKAANAHDFIVKMPDAYNTYVGEHGYNVSGGERQRIAIARAILNNPKILILDEATSALDTESEYLIQEALNRLRVGRTTFAIAHRLSTLRDASRLVVIDERRIAEVGTHNELIDKQGIYYGLVAAQLQMQKV